MGTELSLVAQHARKDRGRRAQQLRTRGARRSLALACSVVLAASCSSTVLSGKAVSMMYDPNRVGGLEAASGPSGIRNNAPKPTGNVENTDHGEIDELSLLAINDIEDFWKEHYSDSLQGKFTPVA